MRGLVRNAVRKTVLAGQYVRSTLCAGRYREDFDTVHGFCLFLGYPRSGHSLVGSLMDAHPDMIFAHEANALKAIRYGFGREALFYWLLYHSRRFTAEGRSYTGYSYEVPGQWQGRYRHLKVIGDKFGNFTVETLARRPGLLERARERVGVPVRFVHVIRNPFDNIATIHRREKYDLSGAVDYYFGLVDDVASFTPALPPEDVLEVHHEDLIRDPAATIRTWCDFLGVDAADDYVAACCGIVYESPHKSRFDVTWPDAVLDAVRERVGQYDFLSQYRFDE